MLTVSTYAELEQAVRRDETYLRLEGEAKHFYEKQTGNTIGGGIVGALPGFLVGGPVGAVIGAAVGAAIGSSDAGRSGMGQRDLQRFLLMYYRRSGSGVTYIELTHR
ncbi:MAG TPA: hypothetical protein DDX71_02850 [Ruminococcus sp.]|nr:hypothetical protein [Ruminococcus sp.]